MKILSLILGTLFFASSDLLAEEETFVTIHKVSGNKILISKDEGTARGRGMRGGSGFRGGRPGMRRGRPSAENPQSTATVTVPANVKITSAMREQRTFEFRVMGELAGGLRNSVFRNIKEPLQARIVTDKGRVTEINVLTTSTDINQSNTDANGNSVIAVRPKRPPMKR